MSESPVTSESQCANKSIWEMKLSLLHNLLPPLWTVVHKIPLYSRIPTFTLPDPFLLIMPSYNPCFWLGVNFKWRYTHLKFFCTAWFLSTHTDRLSHQHFYSKKLLVHLMGLSIAPCSCGRKKYRCVPRIGHFDFSLSDGLLSPLQLLIQYCFLTNDKTQ